MPPLQTAPSPISEATLVGRWLSGPRGVRQTEDGRALRVLFPGVPGGSHGPDIRDAVLELAGDELRGDIEVHLESRGWYRHGHHDDPAYGRVILHLVARNDGGALASRHVSGRAIPIAVTEPGALPGYAPPCTLHPDPAPALALLGLRRIQAKASAVSAAVASDGPAQTLYELMLKTAGGPANGTAFLQLARGLPLAPLLERTAAGVDRPGALSSLLTAWAQPLPLSTRGRPAAHPARRLQAVAGLIHTLWPTHIHPGWPPALAPDSRLGAVLKAPGLGAGLIREIIVNAVLPVAIAARRWSPSQASDELASLAAPGTYGRLKRLEGWLASERGKPFKKAAALQGGLLLHAQYCSRGRCGACPLSPA